MTTIHAGATLERPPGPKYRARLHFAELDLPGPLPRVATLEQWREELGPDFELALVAPRPTWVSTTGPLRLDGALEDAIEWLLEAAEALAARALVFPTDSKVTTGRRDRDRLAAYFERIPRQPDRLVVWAPSGLWEPEMAIEQAHRLDVVYGFDPLETFVPPGPVAYARLRALGGRQRFGDGLLYDVHDALASSPATHAYVAIESPRSFREADRLQQLVGDPERE